MATLEHSYALNSAVALSLNTLHSSLSRYTYIYVKISVSLLLWSQRWAGS